MASHTTPIIYEESIIPNQNGPNFPYRGWSFTTITIAPSSSEAVSSLGLLKLRTERKNADTVDCPVAVQ
jgi:hypothetical protein